MTIFKVHYTRETLDGDKVRGFSRVEAKTPDDANAKVRSEIPRVVIIKTKVDRA